MALNEQWSGLEQGAIDTQKCMWLQLLQESTHQLMRQWRRDLASALKKDTEDFWTVVKHLPGTHSVVLHHHLMHASLSGHNVIVT